MLDLIAEKEEQIDKLVREIEILKAEYEYNIRLNVWYKMKDGAIFFKPETIEGDYAVGTSVYIYNYELARIENYDMFKLDNEYVKEMQVSSYGEMLNAVNLHNLEMLEQYK